MNSLEEFRSDLLKYQDIAKRKADDELSKLRSNAERNIRDVRKRLENLDEDSQEFKENIVEESNAMDKYSQKIYEQIQQTLSNVKEPENITLKTLNQYVESIKNGLAEQDKVLVKYVKLLKDRKYKGRVKSVDKALKRLIKDLNGLEDFIKKQYAPSSGVENASVLVDETIEEIEKYKEQYKELLTHEDEVLVKQKEIDEIENKLQDLKEHPTKTEYVQAREKYENVQRELDYAFSNVRKVFRKYDKYASKNNTGTDRTLLSDLVTDVATAMAKQSSIMSVQNLLKEIEVALEDTALNLSRDKRETAKEDISKFLDGKLEEYYSQATQVVKNKERLEQELVDLDLDNKIASTERDLAAAKRDQGRIYRRKLRSLNDTSDEIEKNVDELRSKMQSISSEPINLEIKLPELPDWIESDE